MSIKLEIDNLPINSWNDILINDTEVKPNSPPDNVIQAFQVAMGQEEETTLELLLALPDPSQSFQVSQNLSVDNKEHNISISANNSKITLIGKFVRSQLMYGGKSSLLLMFAANNKPTWEPIS